MSYAPTQDGEEPDIETLETDTFLKREHKKIDISSEERLRQRKKALFLGSAGIGKTTFFRFTILAKIAGENLPFFYPNENFIPIYIPLKAVENTAPSPILRYLLKTVTMLQKGSLPKLIDLIERRQVMFFLDGYDEIAFSTSGEYAENYVRQELALIMTTDSNNFPFKQIKPEHKIFYNRIRDCRVWLSSRQEFFEQQSILPDSKSVRGPETGLVAISIEGVGNNRAILAKMIFDKHRQKAPIYKDLLSEEYLMQEIDSSTDTELRDLSFNPLFLTVMCYTYIQRALTEKTYKIKIAESRFALIMECINLLLFDLDEIKAQDMHLAERAGLLRRRNDFKEQKIEFLPFLAARLFLEQKTYFDQNYVRSLAKSFFSNRADAESTKIMEGLSGNSSGLPDFVEQLIYSGVFVIVDKSKVSDTLYDLPHRQFREVLASVYFDSGDTVETLLENLELKSLNELVILFFNRSNFQDETLRALLRLARTNKADKYFGLLALKCLEKKPSTYKPARVLHTFFVTTVEENDYFQSPSDLLRFYQPDEEFCRFLATGFKSAIENNRSKSIAVCCALLLAYNKALLEELLVTAMRDAKPYNALSPQLLYYSFASNERIAANSFRWIEKDKKWFLLFCYICASEYPHLLERSPVIRGLIRSLDFNNFTVFFSILWKYRWQNSYTDPPMSLNQYSEAAFAIVRSFPPKSNNKPDSKRDQEFCYVIGEDAIQVSPIETRKKIRLLKYNIYWTKEALVKRLEALGREEGIKFGIPEQEVTIERARINTDQLLSTIQAIISLDFNPPPLIKIFE